MSFESLKWAIELASSGGSAGNRVGLRHAEGNPMLPPFIIDQIRKREEEERKGEERPVIELPLHRPPRRRQLERRGDEEDADRGVIIIDLMGG